MKVAQTCKPLLRFISGETSLWSSHCSKYLDCNEYGNTASEIYEAILANKVIGITSLQDLYSVVLHKYGNVLGLWQSEQSILSGALLVSHLTLDKVLQLNAFIAKPRLISRRNQTIFGSVSVDLNIAIGMDISMLFQMDCNQAKTATCMKREWGSFSKDPSKLHSVTLTRSSLIHSPEIDRLLPACPATMLERLRLGCFLMGPPNPLTGLWPNVSPDEPPIVTQDIQFDPTTVFNIKCAKNCHSHRLALGADYELDLNHGDGWFPLFIDVNYSRIKLQKEFDFTTFDSTMKCVDTSKLWFANYGSHGVELLAMRYSAASNGLVLTAHKVTGDINVPRGQISFRAFIGDGRHKETVGTGRNVFHLDSEPSIFGNDAQAFEGEGQISLPDYRSPQFIPVDVIIISERKLFVYWTELKKITLLQVLECV